MRKSSMKNKKSNTSEHVEQQKNLKNSNAEKFDEKQKG